MDWIGLVGSESFFYQRIDSKTVLAVEHNEATDLRTPTHCPEDGTVIEHPRVRVGHNQLEAGDTLSYQTVQGGEILVREVGQDLMKGVVRC